MPEVDEIAINAQWLRERLVGKSLSSMVFHPHSRYDLNGLDPLNYSLRDLVTTIRNFRIVEVGTKGKLMWFYLHASQVAPMRAVVDRYLHITHGMSGGWRRNHESVVHLPHDAWEITTQGGESSIYYDARKFGTLALLNCEGHGEKLRNLGADVLTSCWEDLWTSFNNRASNKLKTRRDWKTIRELIMDQSIISGIGNYLASEILYRAEIRPSTTYPKLSSFQLERLFKSISSTAHAAYSAGGCTIHTWRNPDGEMGRFQYHLNVYGKTHCPLRHSLIKEKDKAGRNMFWCPVCQR
jgi:formamidopyrimidine-DNA glycosylase